MKLTTETLSISFDLSHDFIFWLKWCETNAGMENMTLTVNGEGWNISGTNIADQVLNLSYVGRLRASTLLTIKDGPKKATMIILSYNAKDVYITPNA